MVSCSNNPPNLTNIQYYNDEKSGIFFSSGVRITGPAKYINKYELDSNTVYGDTTSLSKEYGFNQHVSKRWKYFAAGGGLANVYPFIHVSLLVPEYLSISPYLVLNAKRKTKFLPGITTSITPFQYLAFRGSTYLEYNYSDVSACGTFIGPCGLSPIGPYWVFDGAIQVNIPAESNQAHRLTNIAVGFKKQVDTKFITYFATLGIDFFQKKNK